jgi:hypothetical protein
MSLLLLGGTVLGSSGVKSCVTDAKDTYVECKTQCKSDFDDARGLCHGVAPGCFDACIDGRTDCVTAARQPLTDCLQGCEDALSQARQACRASSGCGGSSDPCSTNANFIACMNPAQLTAFTCRDACRDNFRLDPNAQAALKACAKGFRACVKSCPPASPSGAFVSE